MADEPARTQMPACPKIQGAPVKPHTGASSQTSAWRPFHGWAMPRMQAEGTPCLRPAVGRRFQACEEGGPDRAERPSLPPCQVVSPSES